MSQDLIDKVAKEFHITKKLAKEIVSFIDDYNSTHKKLLKGIIKVDSTVGLILEKSTGKIYARKSNAHTSGYQRAAAKKAKKGGKTGSSGPGVVVVEDK